MYEEVFEPHLFVNLLEFDKIDYSKVLDNFDEQDRFKKFNIISNFIREREKQIGIFTLYKFPYGIIYKDIFRGSKDKDIVYSDYFCDYGIRINPKDYLVIHNEDMVKTYCTVISFIPLLGID